MKRRVGGYDSFTENSMRLRIEDEEAAEHGLGAAH